MVKRCSQCTLVMCREDDSSTIHEMALESVQFYCDRCSKVFDNQSDLSHHKRTHGMYLNDIVFDFTDTYRYIYL